jgi:uncharacterized membrane protein (UPF0127 family)
MKYPIDVAFVDEDSRVVGIDRRLSPGARSGWHRTARSAIELPAATLDATGTMLGDQLSIEEIITSPVVRKSRTAVAGHGTVPGTA